MKIHLHAVLGRSLRPLAALGLYALTASVAHAGDPMVAYCDSTTTPKYRIWNQSTGAWGTEQSMNDITASATFVVLRSCPTRNEKVAAHVDGDKDVNIQFYDGCNWLPRTQVCDDANYNEERVFDVAYEQVSGDALIVYHDNGEGNIGYRTWDGTTLSTESDLAWPPSNKKTHFMSLYPNPASNQIIMIVRDDGNNLYARAWDGSSWGGWTELADDAKERAVQGWDMAWESTSGTGLIVYDENQKAPRYRTWNGSSWSGESIMAELGDKAFWIRLAADPTSDDIIFGSLANNKDIEVATWNGSSWGSYTLLENDVDSQNGRAFDVMYQKDGAKGYCVYMEKDQTNVRMGTWNGTSWSGESVTSLATPEKTNGLVALMPSCCELDEIWVMSSDDKNDLYAGRIIDGTTTTATLLETTLADGNGITLPFMVDGPTPPTVVSWQHVAP